ncbi:MAG TPA: cation transporter [Clostridia bacterium]|nr:cation transporter [Clostridia bacterium]
MKLKVEGMMCGHCKKAVTNALMKEDNIDSVVVDLENSEVTIEGNDLNKEKMSSIISETGYKVV